MSGPGTRVVLAVAGWVAAGALAVGGGLLAISLLGTGITGRTVQPLSQDAVARALTKQSATASASSPSPGRTATSGTSGTSGTSPLSTAPPDTSSTPPPGTPPGHPVTRTLNSQGGSVIARCSGSEAYLVSWTPRQGFEAEDVTRGAADTAFVKFESDDLDVRVSVGCRDGVPFSLARTEED